jgi:hypothetical protein
LWDWVFEGWWVFGGWVFFLVVGRFGCSCVLRGALLFLIKPFLLIKKRFVGVRSFYSVLGYNVGFFFPWKSVWWTKVPLKAGWLPLGDRFVS